MNARSSHQFVPQLERLEDRWCPSCDISVSGSTLLIIGDDGVNVADIEHDGTGGVMATCGGPTLTASGIKKIIIDLKGDNDDLQFLLTGQLNTSLRFELSMGAGNDTAFLDFNAGISGKLDIVAILGAGDDHFNVELGDFTGKGDVKVDVNGGEGNDFIKLESEDLSKNSRLVGKLDGGEGNDHFVVDLEELDEKAAITVDVKGGNGDDFLEAFFFESLAKNSRLTLNYDAGDGNDILYAFLEGSLAQKSELKLFANGGAGDDEFIFDATNPDPLGNPQGVDIAASAKLIVKLDGGTGADFFEVLYAGELDGELLLQVEGGKDNDEVFVDLTLHTGSTGKLDALVKGDDGDDDLTLNVSTDNSGDSNVKAVLDGGSDFDACVATDNVEEKNCEA